MTLLRTFLLFAGFFLLAAFAFAGSADAQTGFKGKVRDGDGRAIAKATVTVRQDGKDLRSATTDSKGKFELTGISSGRYNIVVDAKGYNAGLLANVEAKTGTVRDLGDKLILFVDPGTQIIVRGSVFSSDGRIIPGAKLEFFAIDAAGKEKKVGSSYSNSTGEFGFRHDEGPAKMRVVAKYKGSTGTKDIEIDVAAVYRISVLIDLSKK